MANPDDLASLTTRVAVLEEAGNLLASKLQHALQYVPAEDGVFTFPDGDSWPAGSCAQPTTNAKLAARVAVLTEALAAMLRWAAQPEVRGGARLRAFQADCHAARAALKSAGDPELLAAVRGLVRAVDELLCTDLLPVYVTEPLHTVLEHPALHAWRVGG
jgi:hypothetical protein